MIVEIKVKINKGEGSREKDIDKTVDEVMKIGLRLGGKILGGDVFEDGTSLIIEKR